MVKKITKMISFTVMIRVDGDSKIGMGHVYRSLNLAYVLKKNGHDVIFLTKNRIVKNLASNSFECKMFLNDGYDKVQKIINRSKPDVIIIDKLQEQTKLINIFKKNCKCVVAIDYTGNNKQIIDYGINMLYPKTGIINKNTISGFEYSIMNKKLIYTKPIDIKRKVKSLLVLQGGSDTHCFTPKIINALNTLSEDIKITVVLGPAFNCWSALKVALKDNQKRLNLLHNIKNMPTVMSKHDVAITAGGMTLLELAHMGIPSVVICGEEFENETAGLLQKKGFGINLGFGKKVSESDIALATKQLLKSYDMRTQMNKAGKKLVDGKGVNRVASAIIKLGLK